MTNPEGHSTADEIHATLSRMYALIETSDFTREEEREALRQELDALRCEIDEEHQAAEQESRLPAGFHEALQKTEVLAIHRLLEAPAGAGADAGTGTTPGREDLHGGIREIMTAWEARHPRLAVALAKFTDVLAKLGI